MASATQITKRNHHTTVWEWEVHDISKHFGHFHDHTHSRSDVLSSGTFQAGEGTPKHSSWKIDLWSNLNLNMRITCLKVQDYQNKSFDCQYVVNIRGRNGSISTVKRHEVINSSSGPLELVSMKDLCSKRSKIFPDNVVKIVIKMTLLLDTVHTNLGTPKLLEPTQTLYTLVNCYASLLNNENFSDVKIVCGESTFFGHKLVLSVRSSVLRTMLAAPMKESKKNIIVIKDMEPTTLELMLKYIYTGKLQIPEEFDSLLQLLNSAEMYDLHEVKAACLSNISAIISDANAAQFAMAAYNYNAGEQCTAFIQDYCMKRHAILMQNPEYKKTYFQTPIAFVGNI